jgi:hypothetical protein
MLRAHINEHFRVRQPGTDLYWTLPDSHAVGTAADDSRTPTAIELRPGIENALTLMYDDGRLFDSKREHYCDFERYHGTASDALKLIKFTPSNGPWQRWSIDFSCAGTNRIMWHQHVVAPSDDGRNLTLTDAGFEWQFERMHSDSFETAFANLVATNKLKLPGLPRSENPNNVSLSRLDMEDMFQHALALTDPSACNQAVASILGHYADSNFYCTAIDHFIDLGDRAAAFYLVGEAFDQFGYRGDGPVRVASLKAFVQFYRAATDAKHRTRPCQVIKNAAESELLDAISHAVKIGNDDFVALIAEIREVTIEPAKLEEIVTAATNGFLDALRNGSSQVTARRIIFVHVISGRFSNEAAVSLPAISGAILSIS